MQQNFQNYEFCIKGAIDNAKKRIDLLDEPERNSVLEEYREWLNEDFSNYQVLLFREDPII